MPRGPGGLYAAVAAEVERLGLGEAREYRNMKEVHVVLGGGRVLSVKVSERRWRVPPGLLRRYAAGALRRGKELGRRVLVLVVVRRATVGALRDALRRRWYRLLPLSAVRDPMRWLRWLLREMLTGGRGSRSGTGTRSTRGPARSPAPRPAGGRGGAAWRGRISSSRRRRSPGPGPGRGRPLSG